MSKKPFILIISAVLGIFLLALLGYYFIIQNNASPTSGAVSGFKNFFPFGGTGTNSTVTTGETPQPVQTNLTNFNQKLRKLSTEPVAGAGVADFKAGSVVRYVEKATGHIFEVELFSPNQNRISNTTIPLVYDAVWGNGNNSLVGRFLKDDDQTIDTYSITIKGTSTSTENSVSAVVFPRNLSEVAVLGSNVFYLQQNDESSVGYISSFAGGNKKQIWNSPIKELLPQYVNVKTVALTTKPASNVPGFLYFVDTGSGQARKILGNVLGLSDIVNDTATQVLFIEEGEEAQMFLFDQKNKTRAKTTPTTFPEKCAWSRKDRNIIYCAVPKEFINGESLTSWYKGLVSFTDDIWKYDIKNNTSSVIENLSDDAGTPVDVIKPILSDSEQYLVFINKIDNTLWSLDLTK